MYYGVNCPLIAKYFTGEAPSIKHTTDPPF